MNRTINTIFCSIVFFITILLPACRKTSRYNFSLNNTLAIFLLRTENNYYFCIPVQYMGDYQINNFEFVKGYIKIGGYELLLKRNEIKITVYLNETADIEGSSIEGFKLIYSEENGAIVLSKMDEPLTAKHEPNETFFHYYIFIEIFLNGEDIKNIAKEYEKDNISSKFGIEYNITIDGELQAGSGLFDEFELHNGFAIDPVWYPQNLNFFKAKYIKE